MYLRDRKTGREFVSHQLIKKGKLKSVSTVILPIAIAVSTPALSEAVFEGARDTEFFIDLKFSSADVYSHRDKDPFTGEVSYDDFRATCYGEVTNSYRGEEDLKYAGMGYMFFDLAIEFTDGHVVSSMMTDMIGRDAYADSIIETGDGVGFMNGIHLGSKYPAESDLDELISTILFRCNHENIKKVTFTPVESYNGRGNLESRSGNTIDRREFTKRAKVTVSGKVEVVRLIGNFPNSD